MANHHPIIRAYGLHWRIEHIYWGKAGTKGTLLGAKSRSRNAQKVDFREQRGIYALYADYELVYVGQTGPKDQRLFKRLKDHKKDHLSERWNRFSWFGTLWVRENSMLSADTNNLSATIAIGLDNLEAIVIAVSEPRLNLQRGKWGQAKKYFQYLDDRLKDADDREEEEE